MSTQPPGGGDPFAEWPSPGATPDEARQAAEAISEAARVKAEAAGTTPPGWTVDPQEQAGWRNVDVSQLSPQQLQLVQDVMSAPEVIVGRSSTIGGALEGTSPGQPSQPVPGTELSHGMLTLDSWLTSKGIPWDQKEWQDVYNHALYLRTADGNPVNVMAGGGYTGGEVAAAEAGAAIGGITNIPYWPGESKPAAAPATPPATPVATPPATPPATPAATAPGTPPATPPATPATPPASPPPGTPPATPPDLAGSSM